MIARKILLLMAMGLAGRENGGKAKNCPVLRRVLTRVSWLEVLARVLARYIGILGGTLFLLPFLFS